MNQVSSHESSGKGPLVCVTGASGFAGTHVVKLLLERGYRVRAVVRDPADEQKTAHLRRLAAGAGAPIEIAGADLTAAGSLDAALSRCDLVCHAAAAVMFSSRHPQRDIIDPTLKAADNLLQAVRRSGSVRRMVMTSSTAAVSDQTKPHDHVFTEEDWFQTEGGWQQPYGLAKTLAEKAAWALHEELSKERDFRLVTINPSFILGPVYSRIHLRSSPAVMRDLLVRKFPACPRLHFNIVDVRDVARAHVAALEKDDASGRYILSNKGLWLHEMAAAVAPHFPKFRIPTKKLPGLAILAAALFDKRLSFRFLWRNLGKTRSYSGARGAALLQGGLTPIEATLIDTCRSIIENGLV